MMKYLNGEGHIYQLLVELVAGTTKLFMIRLKCFNLNLEKPTQGFSLNFPTPCISVCNNPYSSFNQYGKFFEQTYYLIYNKVDLIVSTAELQLAKTRPTSFFEINIRLLNIIFYKKQCQ